MKEIPDYYKYWGKAGKSDGQYGDKSYHLLPYHCLDVAAVGYYLLDPNKALSRQLAMSLEVDTGWLQNWFTFCLALHDVGKFCRAFQNLVPGLSEQLVPYEENCELYDSSKARHDSLGFGLWQKILVKRLRDVVPVKSAVIKSWLEVVCGHHGQPPKNNIHIRSLLLADDERSAEAFVRDLITLLEPDFTPLEKIDRNALARGSWQLAGIAVLADWLGSDQTVFQYKPDPIPLEDYWEKIAIKQAKKTLDKAAFKPRQVEAFTSIQQQFDFIETPTPLQDFAQKVMIVNEPQLFILEDVTGAGKTEAAMILTHRLMSVGLAQGLYVGLPTMATANAMYSRLAASYRSLYSSTEREPPSLVLAHGASQLSEAFRQSVQINEQPQDQDYDKDDYSASAYCNAWLADSRKKALLADIGVGTIDQALLAILPAKHQSLRLLGLSGKVLLVDEVHAYDTYMQQLLSVLLKAHAAQGGSVILMSATLPSALRKKLVDAYASGLHSDAYSVALNETSAYPLVSHYRRMSGLLEYRVDTRDSVRRSVKVKHITSEEDAIQVIKQAVRVGRCICWVRNTVNDALSVFQKLSQDQTLKDCLTLFHSRFAMIDRQSIECDVIDRFGKRSKQEVRRGQILIATQVVEQSLDLDFDVMISDLAPIDLLIQRAGRLQRHIRDKSGNPLEGSQNDLRDGPCLYLLSPDPEAVEDKNWLRYVLPGTQSVYKHVGQLWLTSKLLRDKKGFRMPEDARYLIEGVYGEVAQDLIPAVLEEVSQEAEAEEISRRNMGNFNRLLMEKGYNLASGGKCSGWDNDINIPTRLSANSITVVLVKPDGQGELQPYAERGDHPWALSQINLPIELWEQAKEKIPGDWVITVEQLKQSQPSVKWLPVFPLIGDIVNNYCPNRGWLPDK
ncbi:CRISPR-associated helicase Cas3' [Endozoicomonas sp. Mp262]|uniref:CRISPR-associated helicase Cas3' n=1 Tax=Endozoicomonas sp. Mp262 TaxID=2919499 RepID=UPI0021D8031A